MFTIDLLKGCGVPIKNKPEGIAVAAITCVVPVIVTIVMLSYYLHTKVAISIQKQGITNYQKKTAELSDSVKLQRTLEDEKNIISGSLSEVSSLICKHHQWTPILVALVQNMPDSMILTRLDVKQDSVRMKVPQEDNPEKMTDVTVPVRTLKMGVSGNPQYNCDKAVKDFRDRLRFSAFLGPKLEDIRVSKESDTLEGQDVVFYDIDCIFKPEL